MHRGHDSHVSKQGFILARFAGAFKAHLRVEYISERGCREEEEEGSRACQPLREFDEFLSQTLSYLRSN